MSVLWAAMADCTLADLKELQKDPDFIDRCTKRLIQDRANGAALESVANEAMLTFALAIHKAVGSDEFDTMEKVQLAKPLQHILDAADKRKAQNADKGNAVPVCIIFENGNAVSVEFADRNPPKAETIDVETVAIDHQSTGESDTGWMGCNPEDLVVIERGAE